MFSERFHVLVAHGHVRLAHPSAPTDEPAIVRRTDTVKATLFLLANILLISAVVSAFWGEVFSGHRRHRR